MTEIKKMTHDELESDLLDHIDALEAENADLRDKLAAYSDGRPVLHREPGGPIP